MNCYHFCSSFASEKESSRTIGSSGPTAVRNCPEAELTILKTGDLNFAVAEKNCIT